MKLTKRIQIWCHVNLNLFKHKADVEGITIERAQHLERRKGDRSTGDKMVKRAQGFVTCKHCSAKTELVQLPTCVEADRFLILTKILEANPDWEQEDTGVKP